MHLAPSTSTSAAIARKHYAASIILCARIARDRRDEVRGNARDRVVEACRGL
jgi:hypothetical protein